MATTPHRRWYQFSLLRLFFILTLLAVLLGGRIEYLRRMVVFHETESLNVRRDGPLGIAVWHEYRAKDYRKTMVRPWARVGNDSWVEDLHLHPVTLP